MISVSIVVLWLLQAWPDPLGWAVPVSWVHLNLERTARPLGQPCKATGVLLVCRGCQEKVLTSLIPADAHRLALQGSFSPAQCLSGLARFPPSLWDLQLHVLPQFLLTDGSLLPVRQWDTSYCDPKQTDLPVLGWSSSSGGCSSRSDPQIMSSEAVLAMMMSCYKCVTQLIDIYVHSVIQQTMAGFSLVTSNSKFGLGWHFLFRPFSLQHLPFLQIWSEAFPDMKGDLIFLVQLITPNLNYSLHFFFSFHSPQLHFTLRA